MISLLKKGIQMNPAYFIFVNFAGFLLIFNLLVEPIKAITISAVASCLPCRQGLTKRDSVAV